MAYWEHARGVCSTYYLLHTAAYWTQERFVEKCLQLQDFGHEVGLHTNLLTEWLAGQIDDVAGRLSDLLTPLRAAGVKITGLAGQGDRACYEQQFINYWPFHELRPADPATSQTGLCAEGIPAQEDRYRITYPAEA
jgi:hypothetical protein